MLILDLFQFEIANFLNAQIQLKVSQRELFSQKNKRTWAFSFTRVKRVSKLNKAGSQND